MLEKLYAMNLPCNASAKTLYIAIGCGIVAALFIASLNSGAPEFYPTWHVSDFDFLPDADARPLSDDGPFIPDITDDTIVDATPNDYPVHFVRFYANPPGVNDSLCWIHCLSLLSVMMYIQPQHIYLHTNYPDFWPFDPCNTLISNWSTVQVVAARRRYVIGRFGLSREERAIRHEADIGKLYALVKHGGIALDFDVYMMPNITNLLSHLQTYECIASQENLDFMNIGFLACRKGAAYVRDFLMEYIKDYRSYAWVHNSGFVPMQLYKTKHNATVYMDDMISTNPNWYGREDMSKAVGRVNWRIKPAYHAFFTDCSVTASALNNANTSLLQLFSSIVNDAAGRRLTG
ncbi:uncharacterized protein LOC129595564 [Paramacrobiotus metropolitanus]|uniref:uncharacterized protein LOC129595564 n=1 Tax=Paramacrobiotus metropolitanus TaxID=2943436 RepID=UPI00244612F3|nr:uncharacterized protein LOC129595564 [Paramacrobiotus metropolitanus]